uniref:Pleckstrin homology, MyTH4 and FERM domain containing H3 n=1 Tax=Leptobrachium leishanense TaxID=445787 RepID=A0A8C5MGM2_9ANUR
ASFLGFSSINREVTGGVKTPWSRLKKFWFVLTPDSLDYYNNNEKSSKRVGSLVLTSLCSVIWPSKQSYKETGYWNVTVYGRKHCFRLYTEHLNEAVHWVCAIQKVIDSKAPLETPTQLLIKDIEENYSNSDCVEQIYKLNPILRYTKSPLYAPLLPFSYGSQEHSAHEVKGYTALRDEAVRMFSSLQQMESERDPVPLMQGVLQTCLDLRPLRDEVYCQVIKQTTEPPEPGSTEDLRYWQLLTCMSCTYRPSPAVLRFLQTHLHRTCRVFPSTETEKYAAFIGASLEKTRQRRCVPSCEEISVLLKRQELPCMIHYPGAGACKMLITSHTTAEEVSDELMEKLNLAASRNVFALYEQNSHYEQALSKASVIADTLTCKDKGFESRWRLYFKLYCFINTDDVPRDSLEYAFLFEQAHEAVIRGHIPITEDTLQSLAALRLQFLNGDFSPHAPFPRLEELFPVYILHSRVLSSSKPPIMARRSCTSFQKGIFSKALPTGLWNNSLEKQKAEESQKFKGRMKEESANMMSAIVDKWKVLQSMLRSDVMTTYLSIVQQWPGYGSTLEGETVQPGGGRARRYNPAEGGRDGTTRQREGETVQPGRGRARRYNPAEGGRDGTTRQREGETVQPGRGRARRYNPAEGGRDGTTRQREGETVQPGRGRARRYNPAEGGRDGTTRQREGETVQPGRGRARRYNPAEGGRDGTTRQREARRYNPAEGGRDGTTRQREGETVQPGRGRARRYNPAEGGRDV